MPFTAIRYVHSLYWFQLSGSSHVPTHRSSKTSPKPSKRVKEARHWDGVVSREEAASFDRSKSGDGGQVNGEFQPDVSTMARQSTLTVSHQ